jgi:hypothetical protein
MEAQHLEQEQNEADEIAALAFLILQIPAGIFDELIFGLAEDDLIFPIIVNQTNSDE